MKLKKLSISLKNTFGHSFGKTLVTLLFALIFSATNPALAYVATVSRVIDGDTVVLENGTHIRLAGIDAPEHNQAYGPQAKEELEHLVLGRFVDIVEIHHDKYGRTVAWIGFSQDGDSDTVVATTSANALMVAAGFAWHYRQYDKNDSLDRLEQIARENHMGLWADPAPMPPWIFRENEKMHKHLDELEKRLNDAEDHQKRSSVGLHKLFLHSGLIY